jgi:hypothetical protein
MVGKHSEHNFILSSQHQPSPPSQSWAKKELQALTIVSLSMLAITSVIFCTNEAKVL